MRAGYIGIVVSDQGIRIERGVEAWRITRPAELWGLNIGFVWGPYRDPIPRPFKSPWFDKPLFVIRWTGKLFGLRVLLPWFHIWHWPKASRKVDISERVWKWHPARLYIGFKLFHVAPLARMDPAGHVWARPDERPGDYTTFSMSFRVGGKGR